MLFIKLVWLQRTASSLLCTHSRFVFLPDNGDGSNSERAEPKNRYSFERGRVPLCRTAGKDFTINPGSSASCCWNFQGVDMILFWKKQTVQSLLQKKNILPSWDSVVWMTLCRPLEAVIDLETCAYLLKLSGNTCTNSPGFEFWRWVTLIRQERLVEIMGLLSSEMLYSDPEQRGFLSVIMWHLGWSRYFLWRAVQLPPGGPGCWLRPLTTTSWSSFFVTYQTPVRPNKASALARS